MRRSVKVALAVSTAVASAALGAVPTSAQQQYPKVGPWEKYVETSVFPKKTACQAEVSAHEVGALRIIELSKTKQYYEFKDSSTVTFTNTATKQTWKNGEGGDAIVKSRKGDFDTIAVTAEGDNWAQGKGVYGIPWSRGDISFIVTDANDAEKSALSKYDVTHAKIFIQVCYKVGSSPVNGKNVVPEEASAAAAALKR